jgi:hypothetical protein
MKRKATEVIGRPLQLAAGEHARGIAVDQNAQQKVWMIGSLTAAAIAANHRPQVQAPDHLHHEPRQMPLRQPLVHRRRQQETGVAVDRAEGAHARKIRRAVINGPRILAEPSQRVKSDGLLVAQSAPDGQTVLADASPNVVNPFVLRDIPFDYRDSWRWRWFDPGRGSMGYERVVPCSGAPDWACRWAA